MESVRELIGLTQKRKQLESDLKEIKDEIEKLGDKVLILLENEDLDKVTMGGITVSPKRTIRAIKKSGVETADAIKALDKSGLNGFAPRRIDYQSLSAIHREWDRENESIPAELSGFFETHEIIKVGVTMNGGSK